MSKIIKGVYNRRRPEQTDYYRIIEHFHDEFIGEYPDSFESRYGWLKQETINALYAFLDCGIPEHGVARIRCGDCGNDYFIAFSCRKRNVCPSCSTKRSMLFAEKVGELIKPVKHIHITFTIPKLLRAYFRRNRKLLKFLSQSANYAVNKYFRQSLGIEDGMTGGIYYIQTQGSLYNYHPHLHALVCSGLEHEGIFYEEKTIATKVIAELFKNRLLKVLTEEYVLTEELKEMLLQWNHNSGFNVHSEGKIDGRNKKVIESVALYLSRAPISVDRVSFDTGNNKVIVHKKSKSKKRLNESVLYTVPEFLALVISHIPGAYESLVFYYGLYSSSHRGKEKREQADKSEFVIEEEEGAQALTGKGNINSTWARLIQKLFETDPLKCSKCGGEMQIIAFIRKESEIKKILRHINQETIRPPPLQPATSRVKDAVCEYVDEYIPTTEDYLLDPIYPD